MINLSGKFVTVFGSSIPKENDEEYKTAYELGKKLALAKLNICSGGYQGIMDAVSKGANEFGAEAIGVTLDIYNATPSKFLTKEIRCKTLFERLNHLIEIGDAFIVLQGGTGTLVELAIVWEYMNKKMIKPKPFACHSDMWEDVLIIMEEQIKKEKRQLGLLKHFDSINDCAEFIIQSLTS